MEAKPGGLPTRKQFRSWRARRGSRRDQRAIDVDPESPDAWRGRGKSSLRPRPPRAGRPGLLRARACQAGAAAESCRRAAAPGPRQGRGAAGGPTPTTRPYLGAARPRPLPAGSVLRGRRRVSAAARPRARRSARREVPRGETYLRMGRLERRRSAGARSTTTWTRSTTSASRCSSPRLRGSANVFRAASSPTSTCPPARECLIDGSRREGDEPSTSR